MDELIAAAADAVRAGEAVVYPTETVYGLGADATDPAAVERVFDLKRRDRDRPLSAAFPAVDAALDHVAPTDRAERFMRAFLPGPVTAVVERRSTLPPVLTAGRDRVGVRVPDHEVALALLRAAGVPVTATSANVSGNPSVSRPADLDLRVRDGVAAVVDGGDLRSSDSGPGADGGTPGPASTVVDPERGVLHRRGTLADEVEAWLSTEA